jgi:hypothetical protein
MRVSVRNSAGWPAAIAAANFAVVSVAAAAAQPWSNVPPRLQRVDPGTTDVDPLHLSLREMQIDLRRPTGFDTVYRLDAARSFGRGGTMYMRMDGGVMAVFPQSVYRPSPGGMVPEIPPGTVFHLGELPPELRPQEPVRPRPPGFVDLSLSAAAPPSPPQASPSPLPEALPEVRSIWNDDEYRRRRVATLLSRAADAETRAPAGENHQPR